MRLARVLDDLQAVSFRDARESAHRRHLSVRVHRQYVRRVLRCGNVRRADIGVVVRFGNVDDNGDPTRLGHRLECLGDVIAGTITPAPGAGREATSDRRSASTPLETATQWRRPE
jgi:hypothetical protein